MGSHIVWVCDFCDKQTPIRDSAPPADWRFVLKQYGTGREFLCPECYDKLGKPRQRSKGL